MGERLQGTRLTGLTPSDHFPGDSRVQTAEHRVGLVARNHTG